MKIYIPSTMFIMYFKKMNNHMLILPWIIMFILIKMSNNYTYINNKFTYSDNLSNLMILLTLVSVTLIFLSSNNSKNMALMMYPIMFILILTFTMSNMFYFYIMFELVLIPTTILIMKTGKQPERLQAGIYLIMYTILASLPLLVSIISMKNNMSFIYMFLENFKFNLSIMIMMAFLVKMPMFFTHLWLPKAHVEAPLEGSMILAAVLLKLGGYGIIRFLPLCISSLYKMSPWIISLSILGASMTSLNCIRQKDMKSLIAYSSVAHMALTLASILTINSIGLTGAIMMMFAHGMASSALFFLVNDLYMKIHSRNIMMFKGLLTISPNISFWWFIFMLINMSAPPSINTMSEIFIISSLLLWSVLLMIPIMISSFTTASFSMSLYINISHNKTEMNPFFSSKQKTFLSLTIHLIPLILLIFKMEMMF